MPVSRIGYGTAVAGDLIKLDTLDVRSGGRKTFKYLSLVDVARRYAVAKIGNSLTASLVTRCLGCILDRLPFRAVQVDSGELKTAFEPYCRRHDLCLFESPPNHHLHY